MPARKKAEGGMTVLVANMISDGAGGYLAKGAVFQPADKEAGEQLKARKLAE